MLAVHRGSQVTSGWSPAGLWMRHACYASKLTSSALQAGTPQPQQRSLLQQGLCLPPGIHKEGNESEVVSLAARVLPWLASCMASQAVAAGSTGPSASSSAATSALKPAAAPAQTAGASARNGHGRQDPGYWSPWGAVCGDRETAERLVHLYLHLDGERRSEIGSAAAFALAQLLQPAVGALLMRTASTDEQVSRAFLFEVANGNTVLRRHPASSHIEHGINMQTALLHVLCAENARLEGFCILQEPVKAKWRYLFGNTLLRMLGQLPLSAELTHHWRAAALAASIKPAPGTHDRRQAELIPRADAVSAVNITEKGKAALEMLMVMLPEFCMRQPMVLTISLLHQWRTLNTCVGRAGRVRQGLAEIEFRHARANGVELEV